MRVWRDGGDGFGSLVTCLWVFCVLFVSRFRKMFVVVTLSVQTLLCSRDEQEILT